VTSDDVNAYLREISGSDFTAKDFRTWAGTMLAARELATAERATDPRIARKHVKAAIARVAETLRNTPAVCRRCYVHPAVVEAYLEGRDLPLDEDAVRRFLERALRAAA
jgi:DNA topoisomerase-1